MAQMSVSARAVDMLGRQQIAGIPTAIHELFKNAHDAYAKNVEIDYFKDQNLLTLRDDGTGMTESDFISKWLTIGTSSKFGVNRKSDYIPEGMNERKLMGEKGIGRLAIASIGRQVLVLSRAERADGLHDMIVALVHWSQFEIPDISISDIIIPTRTFPESVLPTAHDLQGMVKELIKNLQELGNKIPSEFMNLILEDVKLLAFSPEVLFKNIQGKTVKNWNATQDDTSKDDLLDSAKPPVLDGFGKGTHFIIMPCDETLSLDIKTNDVGTTELQKILVGFSNSLSNSKHTAMSSKFRLHQGSSEPEELIEEGFFTPEDAKSADHYIEGEFDEYGQFKGFVTVFKGEPQKHIINWNENYGSKTRCGPFKIKFSYLQGAASDSLVPTEIYTDIKSKLGMYGGLYLYKDGIRVLPYGKQEFDFLKFEEKRTKRAATAFFSYRLMFGAIDIEHDINKKLIEKAGREGLIENIAYREFKGILEHFFDQLAADFFRSTSSNDRFNEIKTKLKDIVEAEKAAIDRRKKLVGPKKAKFEEQLNSFFDFFDDNYFTNEVNTLLDFVESELNKTNDNWSNKEKYSFIFDLKKHVKGTWKKVNDASKVSKPNIGLNKDLTKNWISYLKTKEKMNDDLIQPANLKIEENIASYIESHGLTFSLREQVSGVLEEERRSLKKNISQYKHELTANVSEIDSVIKDKARLKSGEFTNKLSEVMSNINSTPIDTLSVEESTQLITNWENELEIISNKTEEYFSKMRDTVELVLGDLKDEKSSSVDTLAALETENEQVKDSLNQYFDFAQLGMSLGIIQHEFSSTARNVRSSIQSIKPWADKNPKLGSLYKNINNSFSHLDGYLKMFTPLNRRLYRSKVELSGKEIESYLRDIFQERLTRHHIKFEVTHEFKVRTTRVFPSSFLPVFINVVDNAIYWLNSQLQSENANKYIKLDVNNEQLTISNNGPAIASVDEDRIFEFTFSRKSGGRGMGLYISKQSLNSEGFDIELVSTGASPCFAISKQLPGGEE
ncbi:ATP-binding protein [Shewanella sp. TC10]|uniref:ATP-binding protein n=1 Tax=Shewanella sp. TC10 TaxID=1419739 RepID=UPI001892CDF7|nr:ATP-binding protein [Shewanella sp. TC10]